jgi:protoporphyrinogen oxidase
MQKGEMAVVMAETFSRLQKLREAGQAEYAHKDENAFANFDRVAEQLGLDRKQVLWTYLYKHLDGIVAYIKGHKSQRESVHGRIDDAHVYLELLRGMIIEEGEKV